MKLGVVHLELGTRLHQEKGNLVAADGRKLVERAERRCSLLAIRFRAQDYRKLALHEIVGNLLGNTFARGHGANKGRHALRFKGALERLGERQRLLDAE